MLRASLRFLEILARDLETGETSADYQRARRLLAQTMVEFPTFDEIREFDEHIRAIQNRLRLERDSKRVRVIAKGR